jgi:hypothetical protein
LLHASLAEKHGLINLEIRLIIQLKGNNLMPVHFSLPY